MKRPLKAPWSRIGCFPAILLTLIILLAATHAFRLASLATGATCYVVTVEGQQFQAVSVTPQGGSVHVVTRDGTILVTNGPYTAELGPCP